MKGHFSLDLDCWSSVQRSLMADKDPKRATAGLMQSFCRDDNGSCLTVSAAGLSESLVLWEISSSGSDGGNAGRRSSEMNCVSCECVREV